MFCGLAYRPRVKRFFPIEVYILIHNDRLEACPTLMSKLWTADHHLKQHRKLINIFLQRRFHLHQQWLVRKNHRPTQCITEEPATQCFHEILTSVLINIIDQSRDSCSSFSIWKFSDVINPATSTIRRARPTDRIKSLHRQTQTVKMTVTHRTLSVRNMCGEQFPNRLCRRFF